MDYTDAIDLTFKKRSGQKPAIGASPGRKSVVLNRQSQAQELSFKLFDGQCLQYGDHIIDGFYDIWGTFEEAPQNAPAAQYPSLETLAQGSYMSGDVREILVFDRSKDSKLDALYKEAKGVVERHRNGGALVCVEALARLVASTLGGAQSHTDLVQNYTASSQELSRSKQSLVRYVGELQHGLSRHRCLLLKALADSCDLPCRILRGHFYLGAAGSSGENSVAVVQFNYQEWMVELVTQPGRMYQLKKGTIPQVSTEALWGQDGTSGVQPGNLHGPHELASGSGYPTVPGRQDSEEARRSNSSSSGQKDGLQWSDMDGPTMEDLEPSDADNLKPDTDARSSASEDRQARAAAVDEQLQGLTKRIALQRSRSGSEETILTEKEGGSPVAQQAAKAFVRQRSEPTQQTSNRGSTSSDVSQDWQDWEDADTGQVTFEVPDSPMGEIVSVGKYGSNPSGSSGKARARVRGTDQRGRIIEFELEGVTLTSAHNFSSGARILSQINRQSEDVQRGRPLEAMISRYRVLNPRAAQMQAQSQTHASSQPHGEARRNSLTSEDEPTPFKEASKKDGDNLLLRVSALALKPGSSSGEQKTPEYQRSQLRPWQQTMRQFQSSLSDQPVPDAATLSADEEDPSARSASWERGQQQRSALKSGPETVRNPAPSSTLQLLSNPQFKSPARSNQGSSGDSFPSRQSLADRIRTIDEGSFAKSTGGKEGFSPSIGSDISRTTRDGRRISQESQESDRRTSPRLQDHYQPDAQDFRNVSRATSLQPNQRVSSAMFAPQDEDVEVNFDEVELGPRIGIGCFGEVFKARWRQTTVAVKRLFDQSLSQQSLREFRDEVQLNRRLKHPNVIMFMGACTAPPNLSIITQWAPRGSLFHLIHSTKPGRPKLQLRQKLRMALDIARGMHYLHSAKPPVIHRDLKSMNLLVDNDLTIKVCDFGLARTRSSTWMTGRSQGGTPEWTAPEVLRNLNYNEKSDVYSFGVVLYELATEREPWDNMTPMQVVGAVGWANQRLEPPEDCPKIFADLIRRCFLEPENRPSFEEAIRSLLDYAPETRSGGSEDANLKM